MAARDDLVGEGSRAVEVLGRFGEQERCTGEPEFALL
jgi:hypothetical protein